MLEISVLGPLEVRRGAEPVAVPGGKGAELLIRLALDAGRLVRTDQILDELWADTPGTRRNTLQSKVTRLRRALGDRDVIVGSDDGYTLTVDPGCVDALIVLADADHVVQLLDEGDDVTARRVGAAALGRFRGDLLLGAGDAEWVAPHRARLLAAQVALTEATLSARVRLGEGPDVIGDLETAVTTHPYQERLWELLVTALYHAGRQADALTAYQRVRAVLAEDLGLDPGPVLRDLEQRILVHDAALLADAPPRARVALDPDAGNLPGLPIPLVGREAECAELLALIDAHRLVEVVGPGGVGKTALAIECGRRVAARRTPRPGGVWLARLETAGDSDDVIDVLVAALQVTGGEDALFDRVRAAPAMVILDNCEHVIGPVADLVARLVDAAPMLRLLCTSQVPLDVDGETVFELAPLTLDAASDLFTQRATPRRRTAPEPTGTASATVPTDDDAVVRLCRALDGLPLAIELAAARTRTLSIEEITRRLDDRFTLLADPNSRRPPRRRALRATIGWSYDLLFPDDQRGLWALAIFAGGAPLAGVEAVLEVLEVPASAALDVLGRLANRSLVIVDDGDGSVRYRLLDSIQAFARDAMADAGLTDRAADAHAAWYARAAATSTAAVRGRGQDRALAFVRRERANIDAALSWSAAHDPRRALAIAGGFGWAWIVLGESRGSQRLLTALDAVGTDAPPADRAEALLLAAWIEASIGQLDLAHRHIDAAAELIGPGDVELRARIAYYRAYVVSHGGDFAAAMVLTDESDALYAHLDRPWDQAANGLFAARAAISAADEARATVARDQVRAWLERVEDPWLHARAEAMYGELARIQRRYDDAVAHIERAADTSRRLGFRQTEAYQVSSLGRALSQAGDDVGGAVTLALAVEKAEATGDVRLAALARVHLGRIRRALGDDAGARTALETAVTWHRDAGGGEQAALGECLLAALDAADGNPTATARLHAILASARRDGETHVELFALDALARLAVRDDPAAATALCAEADALMPRVDHFVSERDRVDAHFVRRTTGS